jgi:hypothetical protein
MAIGVPAARSRKIVQNRIRRDVIFSLRGILYLYDLAKSSVAASMTAEKTGTVPAVNHDASVLTKGDSDDAGP